MLYIAFCLLVSFIIPMDFVLLLRDVKIWSRNVATRVAINFCRSKVTWNAFQVIPVRLFVPVRTRMRRMCGNCCVLFALEKLQVERNYVNLKHLTFDPVKWAAQKCSTLIWIMNIHCAFSSSLSPSPSLTPSGLWTIQQLKLYQMFYAFQSWFIVAFKFLGKRCNTGGSTWKYFSFSEQTAGTWWVKGSIMANSNANYLIRPRAKFNDAHTTKLNFNLLAES